MSGHFAVKAALRYDVTVGCYGVSLLHARGEQLWYYRDSYSLPIEKVVILKRKKQGSRVDESNGDSSSKFGPNNLLPLGKRLLGK